MISRRFEKNITQIHNFFNYTIIFVHLTGTIFYSGIVRILYMKIIVMKEQQWSLLMYLLFLDNNGGLWHKGVKCFSL